MFSELLNCLLSTVYRLPRKTEDRSRKALLNQNGQTLMELIVVVAVSVIIIGALVFATISSLRNASFSKNQSQATKLAQQGIELVRIGRDRNKSITGGFTIGSNSVTSWAGDNTICSTNTGSIWCNRINTNCGNTTLSPPTYCFFNVTNQGILDYKGVSTTIPSGADSSNPPFQRAVIVSDHPTDSSFGTQKTVTVIVKWIDFSGPHESRLTTILRKI